MAYKRKTVTIKRDDFTQLLLYIQQVSETVGVLKERHLKNFKLEDWLTALEIHTEFLTNYLSKITKENGYKEHLDLLLEWKER